jgi:hypothetical protein
MILTAPCKRGCGSKRKEGGIYLCTGMSQYGSPIEDFIHDPVKPYLEKYHRSPEVIKEENGYYNVKMWVGSNYYKSPWFFVEETRRFGLSRHVSKNIPLEKLTPFMSMIDLIFPFAVPTFDYDCYGEGWYWDNCKVNTHWSIDQPGKHRENKFVNEELKGYWKFCTFAHKDLSLYFANENQFSANAEGTEFTIHFPNKYDEEFTYDGVTPDVECENILNKKNWLPGIVLSLPLTHIEIPHSVKKEDESRIDEVAKYIPIVVTEY